MPQIALWRRLLTEFVGTGLLVTAVVGSGITATTPAVTIGRAFTGTSPGSPPHRYPASSSPN